MRSNRRGSTLWLLLVFALFAIAPLVAQQAAAPAADTVVVQAAGGSPVPSPPRVPDAGANEWGGTLLWGFISATLIEHAKRSRRFAWLSEQSSFLWQRFIGMAAAGGAALGVHYTYDPGAGALTITGLTLVGIWTALTEGGRAWVVQELTYRLAIKGKMPGDAATT